MDCYCSIGGIDDQICAASDCGIPPPFLNCTQLPTPEDQCCPEFDCPLSFPHEYETMNPLIRDDGKNPSSASSEKLNHKPSNADGASLGTYTSKTTTVKPFNLNPNVNGDNSPTHFSSTFQGIKKSF